MSGLKIKNKYKIIFALLIFGAVFLVSSNVSFAGNISIPEPAGGTNDMMSLISFGTTGTTGTMSSPGLLNLLLVICSGIITLLGYLIDFSIAIGKSVISLPIVQTGAQTMISFANLGFVFAIIAMAFATIFRVQSYAMKQTLWKLIVAALLVNFSLTIAGAFISISNIFTDFFLQSLNGKNISDGLMGVLNPQALVKVEDVSIWKITIGMFSYFFKYMASLLFVIVFNFIIILTFLALFIMLLIRAITLGVLLVVMPIIWLLWIFPGTLKYWSEWWSNFIRWTFFAPIVLFFIVLVISSGSQLQKIRQISGGDLQQSAKVEKAFKDSMTLNPDFFDHVTQIIITAGLLLGGLFAANKMGITFASTAMGMAKGGGKMFGGWVGRKGIRLGTLPARSALGQKAIEGMQKLGSAGGVRGFFARNTLGRLGNRLSGVGVQQGEKLISQAESKQKNLSDKQLAMGLSTMANDEKVAALTRLVKNKKLDMVPNLSKYIADSKMKNIFGSYGKSKEYDDLEKTAGFNNAMLTGKNEKGESISLEEATKSFRNSYSIKDYDKLQGDILGEKAAYGLENTKHINIRSAVEKSILDAHPGSISKIRSSLKGSDAVKFQEDLDKYIDDFENNPELKVPMEKREKGISASIKDKLKFFDDHDNMFGTKLSNRARGLYNSRKNFGGSLFGGYGGTIESQENV